MGRDKRDRQNVLSDELALTMGQDGAGNGRPNVIAQMLEEDLEREAEAGRKTKRTPHEERRVGRRIAFSLPDSEWKDAVLEMADRWGLRTSDFLTFCVAHTMHAIDSGELRRPSQTGPIEYHHRAGEALDLPWSPHRPKIEEDRWV